MDSLPGASEFIINTIGEFGHLSEEDLRSYAFQIQPHMLPSEIGEALKKLQLTRKLTSFFTPKGSVMYDFPGHTNVVYGDERDFEVYDSASLPSVFESQFQEELDRMKQKTPDVVYISRIYTPPGVEEKKIVVFMSRLFQDAYWGKIRH